ncbi:DUF6891 domain-containing protein [Brachybacterium sp. DNPG3]
MTDDTTRPGPGRAPGSPSQPARRPALATFRHQPDIIAGPEAMVLDLVLGEPRSTLATRIDELEDDGDLGALLPDLAEPAREDAERFVDGLIREYRRMVPAKSADAIALEQAQERIVGRGVAVVFGPPAFDAGEGAQYGYEAARALPGAVGYCYSHVQDICRLAVGGPLLIGFSGMTAGLGEEAAGVARIVVEELANAGFAAGWSGDPRSRIEVSGLVWEVPAVAQPRSILSRLFPRGR